MSIYNEERLIRDIKKYKKKVSELEKILKASIESRAIGKHEQGKKDCVDFDYGKACKYGLRQSCGISCSKKQSV